MILEHIRTLQIPFALFPDERTLGEELRRSGFDRVMFMPLLSGIVYIHVAEKPAELG